MMCVDRRMLARIYMGDSMISGKHECVSCGLSDCADDKISKKIKSSFTNFDSLMIGTGEYICKSCQILLGDKDLRIRPILYAEKGVKYPIERSEVLDFLKNPLPEYVLSVPYSMKKHHWLYAGLSDRKTAYIGTDNRTVVIDYKSNDIPYIIETVESMIKMSIPRNEIINGKYSVYTRYKIKDIEGLEKIISPLRFCGALELIVKYTPAVKSKIKIEPKKGVKIMISEHEYLAAKLLYELAKKSQIRANDGIRFWGGFFIRRVNRFKNLELHEFISKLSESIGTDKLPYKIISELNESEENQIMDDIRKKTNWILSMAYTYHKEEV